MSHPIFRDAPSTDMTKAQERQAEPAPVKTEVQLVQTERGEVRLAEIPVPASIAASPDDVWKRLRNDIAATKRRLDRLGKKVTGQ